MHTNGNTIPYVLIADRHWTTEPAEGYLLWGKREGRKP
jgi:hypothetical protein